MSEETGVDMNVGSMKFQIDRTDPDFPVYVLGEDGKTLCSITEYKACFLSALDGFSLNINDHDTIREAGGAVILKVDW